MERQNMIEHITPMGRTLLVLVALCTMPLALLGQNSPPMANRQAIAALLNAKLANNETSVRINSTQLFDPVDNACSTYAPLDVTIEYGQNHFVLKRLLRRAHTVATPDGHPLVNDLNDWLNAVWAMDLTQIPEFNDLPWACAGNPSQRYYLESTDDPDLIAALQDATGENMIRNKTYTINGAPYTAAQLLSFAEPGTRTVYYITDIGDNDKPRRRILAGAYLKFSCPNGGPSIEIKFKVQLEDYVPNCGIAKGPGSHIELTGGGTTCIFQFRQPTDERNAAVWEEYLRFRGKWDIYPELVPPDFDSPTNTRPDRMGEFDITSQGELRFRMPHNDACVFSEQVLCRIVGLDVGDEYCEVAYCKGGTFSIDPLGHLIYTPPANNPCGAACTPQPVPCLEFCDYGSPELPMVSGVIKADARTFTDDIDLPSEEEPTQGAEGPLNLFERGVRGKWRPEKEYSYRTAIKPGTGLFVANPNGTSERNYNDAGVFNLQLFSWRYPEALDPEWLNLNTVTLYSRHGEPLEEVNILGIPGAARFGYGGKVPILVAKNSPYYGPFYDSFEEDHFDDNAENGFPDDTNSHSGKWSFRAPGADFSEPIAKNFLISQKALENGMLLRVWTKYTYPQFPAGWEGQCPVDVRLERLVTVTHTDLPGSSFRFIAKTGEWSLYEREIGGIIEGLYNIRVKAGVPAEVSIDDLRLQPRESEMACYAYDPRTLKPVVMFDDQHFGIYYQYNGEGKLVRKIRETERGFRTVEEAQYHMPGVDRDAPINGGGTIAARGGEGSQSAMVARAVLNGHAKQEVATDPSKVDLFEAEFGLERHDVKIFGVDAERLGEKIEEVKQLLEHPAIERLKIPGTEKLRLIEELATVDDTIERLEREKNAASDSLESEARDQALATAAKRKAELLQQLGVSEEEARELIEDAGRIRRELEESVEEGKENETDTEE